MNLKSQTLQDGDLGGVGYINDSFIVERVVQLPMYHTKMSSSIKIALKDDLKSLFCLPLKVPALSTLWHYKRSVNTGH